MVNSRTVIRDVMPCYKVQGSAEGPVYIIFIAPATVHTDM